MFDKCHTSSTTLYMTGCDNDDGDDDDEIKLLKIFFSAKRKKQKPKPINNCWFCMF